VKQKLESLLMAEGDARSDKLERIRRAIRGQELERYFDSWIARIQLTNVGNSESVSSQGTEVLIFFCSAGRFWANGHARADDSWHPWSQMN
jgi:hypothetical protein